MAAVTLVVAGGGAVAVGVGGAVAGGIVLVGSAADELGEPPFKLLR